MLILLWLILTFIFIDLTGIWFNVTPDYNPTKKEKICDKKISKGIGIFWIIWFIILLILISL